jgi:hypothetical protein
VPYPHIRQPGRQLNQPLEFTNLREQLQGTSLPENPLGGNTTNPVESLSLVLEDLVFHHPHLVLLHPLQEENLQTKAVLHMNHLIL